MKKKTKKLLDAEISFRADKAASPLRKVCVDVEEMGRNKKLLR